MRGWIRMAVLIAGVSIGAPAQPQAPAPVDEVPCAVPLVAPAPWIDWGRPAPLVAAVTPDARAAVPLPLGRAAAVTLAPTERVTFAAAPAKAPRANAVTYGGMLSVTVPRAGTYRVAVGAAAWIDMVSSARVVASSAHAHGPACSGIVKMVDFALPAGTTTLELSGAPTPVTTAMVVRVS